MSELVLESREYDLLLGRILPDGSRLSGLIDKYSEDVNGLVNIQNVIQVVAEDSERKGMFEDSVRLYDLAKMHEKTIELLNKLLAQVITQQNVPESRRDRLQVRPLFFSLRFVQVWSLTQFYSVDFAKSRINVKVCFQQTHNQGLRQYLLTVSLYLCSTGSNAQGESRAREGRSVSSKSPSRVRDGDEGVAGRNGRE